MTPVQILAVATATVIALFVIELIRRRRLLEQYAILWIFGSALLLLLSLWPGLLDRIAPRLGIAYPPAVLFLAGILVLVLLAIHFSVIASRVTDQNRKLAQRLALLEDRSRLACRNATEQGFRSENPSGPGALDRP
ncbi:MAG: hypothetical protein Kow0092_03720 [Deferrisomatales bacterium]